MGKLKGIKGESLLLSCSGNIEPYSHDELKVHSDYSKDEIDFRKRDIYKATGRSPNLAICSKVKEVEKK
ncbi:hypothetical protein AKJ51_00045 [candidate division MSBL1 archaeon SCGC-AAA382A20]|uniref:Uncharacterized protein n=1 Tax=candidate division MSBL1 archaeon SCGC-AAA382A20 TaxID=1698280 RepID=A0A133VMQ7_9EURY|nr:hypothetical protein AKJ51_00045 [candidate division MSBL1 archaeon SCGC-AAA382A20]